METELLTDTADMVDMGMEYMDSMAPFHTMERSRKNLRAVR